MSESNQTIGTPKISAVASSKKPSETSSEDSNLRKKTLKELAALDRELRSQIAELKRRRAQIKNVVSVTCAEELTAKKLEKLTPEEREIAARLLKSEKQ